MKAQCYCYFQTFTPRFLTKIFLFVQPCNLPTEGDTYTKNSKNFDP